MEQVVTRPRSVRAAAAVRGKPEKSVESEFLAASCFSGVGNAVLSRYDVTTGCGPEL
jgi:hypothetical protein